jgi:putative drug exporter of the RND superfamily
MSALARWCFQHRFAVVGLWVALLLALGGGAAAAGTSYSEEFSLPGTESTKALELLQKQLPASSGDTDQIVIHVDNGSVQDAAVRTKVSQMLETVSTLPSVTGVTSMYSEQGAAQVSADGRTAFATVQFDKQANELPVPDVEKVIDTAQAARGDGLQVELGGQAIQQVTQAPPGSSELIGIAAAAVILFLAFGSLLGMLLPLLVAVAGVGSGLLAVGLLSHVIGLSSIAPTLAALIGLGVGIDYALFIVTRHRTGLQSGLTPEEAAVRAVNTSGRAVLFAGGTVVIALLGLLVLQLNFLNGLGIGSAVAVAFTILAALTLLPAMLGFFGSKLISKKQRQALITNGPRVAGAEGVWARWSVFVGKHKAVLSTVALLAIVVMSIPTLSIRLGSSDAGNDKADTTTRQAYDLLADGFGPGFNGPLQLVAEVPTAADSQAFEKLLATVKTTEGVAAVSAFPSQPGSTIAIAQVVPTTSPQDVATDDLIDRLRDDVVPAAEQGSSMQVYVGGSTAIFKDFASVLTDKLPLFLGVIIALGCLLLMIAFRSILVPLTAAVMNVLAAAASFGVVVAIFQWGWGSDLLNLGGEGPVEAFVPVIMLAILFGLSMDYQVFLVSRMHEEWTHSRDNERAVRIGQAETGRVITAAALIMIFVFGAFILDGQRVIAEFGIGLAVAVAIDAFILRTVLVPALMHMFGSANWWLPGWLDRILPRVSVEGTPDSELAGVSTGQHGQHGQHGKPGEPGPRAEDDELIASQPG